LAWAPAAGYVVLLDNAGHLDEHAPAALATAADILATAADNWNQAGKPFYGLVRGAGHTQADLTAWPDLPD
jgi:hypothetical protein